VDDLFTDEELTLSTCGELWVLLLLLLPHHLRGVVAVELSAPQVRKDIVRAVRCPWALPLEALCESLDSTLLPSASMCGKK
jgi:hypothetical protein